MILQVPADLYLEINLAAEGVGLSLNTWMLLAFFRLIGEEVGEDDVQD